jgi:hypothetical protein
MKIKPAKHYVHEKKNQLDSILFKAGEAQRQPELFEIILDENGNQIEGITFSKKNELTGAGIQYVMSIIDYYCTHKKNELMPTQGIAKRMQIPTLTWGMAIDLATGGLTAQRGRAQAAILNLRSAQKPVFIEGMDGTQYNMIPFVIDLTYESGEKATAKSAAKLARLLKKPTSKREEEAPQPFRVIKYIDIQFALPLYEGFFQRKTGNYSFPNAMYAKFFRLANVSKKSVIGNEKEKLYVPSLDTEIYIDFYCSFTRYFARHNNLEKGKTKSVIHKYITDIFIDIYPSMIQWVNGTPFIKDRAKAGVMIKAAIIMMLFLPGFSCYPIANLKKITPEGKITFELYTDREEAYAANIMVTYSEIQEKDAKEIAKKFMKVPLE